MNSYIFAISCSMFISSAAILLLTALVELEQHVKSYFSSAEAEPRQPVPSKTIVKVKVDTHKKRSKRQAISPDLFFRLFFSSTTPKPIVTEEVPVLRKIKPRLPNIPRAFEAHIKFPRTKPTVAGRYIDFERIYASIISILVGGILGIILGLVIIYYLRRWHMRPVGLPLEPAIRDYMMIYHIFRENVADQEQVNVRNDFEDDIERANLEENGNDDRQAVNVGIDQYI